MTTIKKKITITYLSFFGSGFFPKAPGTMGSIATIPLLVLLHFSAIDKLTIILATTALIAFTCYITEQYQRQNHLHDPQWIVIDEVLGMITSWLFLAANQHHWKDYLLIFVLFRIFDIVKIWPASFFDRMEHGAGTILDDIVSGLFTGVSYILIQEFISPYFY